MHNSQFGVQGSLDMLRSAGLAIVLAAAFCIIHSLLHMCAVLHVVCFSSLLVLVCALMLLHTCHSVYCHALSCCHSQPVSVVWQQGGGIGAVFLSICLCMSAVTVMSFCMS